jgi:cell division protein FtsB
MLFFDQNDWFTQRARRKQLDATQQNIDFLRQESERMEREIDELHANPRYLEKYAREKYHEKQDNEDVYLIIRDSVTQKRQEQ